MIQRYSTEDMARIWSDHNRFNTWKIVELAVVKVMKDKGIIPENSCKIISESLSEATLYISKWKNQKRVHKCCCFTIYE